MSAKETPESDRDARGERTPAHRNSERLAYAIGAVRGGKTEDGWWAYFQELPGCTVERNAREAIAAHVALLRDTGRPVPEPTRTAV